MNQTIPQNEKRKSLFFIRADDDVYKTGVAHDSNSQELF